MSETSKEANLARVRDNQRRSRARRKEYLSELETKYQNCERVGAEASAEIQMAARLVLADNKRLRAMLKAMGVSDVAINGNGSNAAAPKKLEGMLSQRRACGGGAVKSTERPRLSPVAGARPVASVSPRSRVDSPAFEALDRWSDGSRIHATGMKQVVVQQRHPVLNPRALAQGPTPPQYEEQQEPCALDALNCLSDESRIHATEMNQLLGEQQQPPHSQNASAYATPEDTASMSSGYGMRSSAPSNSKSCYEVADTIRMMHPHIGNELEADMGCGKDGGECSVSNLQAFDVLDRWSDGSRVFAMGLPGGS